jgi:3-isopropylmalate/(R)-2-methylmalate dehydratase small subunit
MQRLTTLTSRTVVLPASDIDTDQIIPARFLTTTTREGLGGSLFYDWRFDAAGNPRADFPLNQPDSQHWQILVAGRNFGCGSSREHAAWALLDFGIRAVISTEIADIFRSNALKNGLLPVVLDVRQHDWLLHHPGTELSIDIASSVVQMPDGTSASFPIDPFSRYCLLEGVDQLGYLLKQQPKIAEYERANSK